MKVDESLELTGMISQPAGNERHTDCLKEMPAPESIESEQEACRQEGGPPSVPEETGFLGLGA